MASITARPGRTARTAATDEDQAPVVAWSFDPIIMVSTRSMPSASARAVTCSAPCAPMVAVWIHTASGVRSHRRGPGPRARTRRRTRPRARRRPAPPRRTASRRPARRAARAERPAAVRFHTVTSKPARSSERAIRRPSGRSQNRDPGTHRATAAMAATRTPRASPSSSSSMTNGGSSRRTFPSLPQVKISTPCSWQPAGDLLGRRRAGLPGRRFDELDRHHPAPTPDLRHRRQHVQRSELASDLGLDAQGRPAEVLDLHRLDGGQGSRAGHRVPAVGPPEATGVDRVHDLRSPGHRGEGKSAADPFRVEIRSGTTRSTRSQPAARPAEAGLDLIRDEHDPWAAAQVASAGR